MTQAVSRDILADAMLRVENTGTHRHARMTKLFSGGDSRSEHGHTYDLKPFETSCRTSPCMGLRVCRSPLKGGKERGIEMKIVIDRNWIPKGHRIFENTFTPEQQEYIYGFIAVRVQDAIVELEGDDAPWMMSISPMNTIKTSKMPYSPCAPDRSPSPSGLCLYCLDICPDRRRWCNAECRDAWERER